MTAQRFLPVAYGNAVSVLEIAESLCSLQGPEVANMELQAESTLLEDKYPDVVLAGVSQTLMARFPSNHSPPFLAVLV